jgi:hypothetical protein
LDTVFPLGELETVFVTTSSDSTDIVLQRVADSTSANVGVLKITILNVKM